MKEHEKNSGDDLIPLEDLSPLKRGDDHSIRALFPKESTQHTGRMRVALVRELIRRYGGDRLDLLTVADPMTGTGSTGVAAALEGCAGFVGCELVEYWGKLAGKAVEEAQGTQPFHTQIMVGNASVTPYLPFLLAGGAPMDSDAALRRQLINDLSLAVHLINRYAYGERTVKPRLHQLECAIEIKMAILGEMTRGKERE